MSIDPTNSQRFANSITNAILETLTRQADAKQLDRIHGRVTLNPQTFQVSQANTLNQDASKMTQAARQQYFVNRGQDKRHLTVGPIKFTTTFSEPPHITFGQGTQPLPGDISIPGPADNYTPFLATPYLYSWHHTGGQVDGFYLGVYAMTTPPKGVTQHVIHWTVEGRASRYKGRGLDESWKHPYDFNMSNFLVHSGS